MHRAISIKHRIVRRVDIDKAPLATFDTVDLGDEDIRIVCPRSESKKSTTDSKNSPTSHHLVDSNKSGVFIQDGGLKSGTIGGSNSKKSLSQAGGEEKESKDDRVKDKSGCSEIENVQEAKQGKGAVTEALSSDTKKPEVGQPDTTTTHRAVTVAIDTDRNVRRDVANTSVVTTLARQTTIGRVNIPIKKQDSDSSSSSPGSCSDTTFTFQASRPSVGHFERTCAEGQLLDSESRKAADNLVPEYLDPSQILSPSKRKAYERRIERLKVTTSPIARPRSAAPINVVSLDEYAAISCPEPLPAIPVVQDKLKITLPLDEFTTKPKTPKLHSAKRQNSEDTCFEFTEEFLFSRTKSALVVTEDGQLPLSPRRVLIPPNLTPSTSPQLSASPRLSPISFYDTTLTDSPKLIYIQQSETTHKIFAGTSDESEQEDWAHFPECSQTDDNVEHDTSTSTVCDTQENELDSSVLADQLLEWTTTSHTNIYPTTETLPIEHHLGALEECALHNQACSHAHTDLFSEHSDQIKINLQEVPSLGKFDNAIDLTREPGRCSTDVTFQSIRPFMEVPHVRVDPEFESEEIITIEISQPAGGCEKHIGIEIRSGDSSESVSPVCFDRSPKLWSPDSDSPIVVFSEIPNIQQNSHVWCHSNSELDNPVSFDSISISAAASASYSEGDLQGLTSDTCFRNTELSIQRLPGAQLHVSSPFSDQLLIPETSTIHSVNDTIAAATTQLSHPQQQSEQLDEKLELRQRPPSTNPFDIDFQPLESDTFDYDLRLQSAHTNPFIEQASSASGDLFLFPSSMNNSST